MFRSSKYDNRALVLDDLRTGGRRSIAEIAIRAGITAPTAQKIIDLFSRAGLVVSAGKGQSTEDGGKRPSLYEMNPLFGCAVSVHIWPDRMTTAVTDLRSRILLQEESPVDRSSSLTDVVERAVEVVGRLSAHGKALGARLVGVAIALPGIADARTGVSISSPHYPGWAAGFPVRDELLKRMGAAVPVYVDKVNRFQALAEGSLGLAKGAQSYLIVDALVEGLGAGIVRGGRMIHGAHELSGEIGHMILDPDGYPCICGARGCFEAMVSARRLMDNVEAGRASHPDSILSAGPRVQSVETVFDAFKRGDPFARKLVDEVIRWFALGLNNVLMVLDPEIVILQGIYSAISDYFLSELKRRMHLLGLPAIARDPRIEYSAFGPERGIVGGSLFVCQNYFASGVWEDLPAQETRAIHHAEGEKHGS
jgi:predicted NBD/HSP70 family sugar kinase